MSRPRGVLTRVALGLVALVCALAACAWPASALASAGRLGVGAAPSPGAILGAQGILGAGGALGAGGVLGSGGALGAGGLVGAGGTLGVGGGSDSSGALGAGEALNPICGAAGAVSGAIGSTCNAAQNGVGGLASTIPAALGLAGIGTWVLGGAQVVLDNTATELGRSTAPALGTTWFSSTYWRMAAVAAVLTLPFLFAAAVQAVIRSDLGLLASATFGYLPLAALAIAIAAPLTMLLLAASDELSAFVSSAAGNESTRFLGAAGLYAGGVGVLLDSPFLAFLVGLFTVAVAFAVWVELLLREAAVYVVVLMLPLAFAALVWPARRVWAMRAVELLVALILAKFAIVAVLSLGGAAIAQSFGQDSISGMMAGAVLLMLAAFSPWALLRLIPLAELAGGAAGALRGELHTSGERAKAIWHEASGHADDWAASTTAGMRRQADDVDAAAPRPLPELPPGQPGADPAGSPDRDGPPGAGSGGKAASESAGPAVGTGAEQRPGPEGVEADRESRPGSATAPGDVETAAESGRASATAPEEDEVVREGNWEEPLVLGRESGQWIPRRVVLPEDEAEP